MKKTKLSQKDWYKVELTGPKITDKELSDRLYEKYGPAIGRPIGQILDTYDELGLEKQKEVLRTLTKDEIKNIFEKAYKDISYDDLREKGIPFVRKWPDGTYEIFSGTQTVYTGDAGFKLFNEALKKEAQKYDNSTDSSGLDKLAGSEDSKSSTDLS